MSLCFQAKIFCTVPSFVYDFSPAGDVRGREIQGVPCYWWIGEYFGWNYGSKIHISASYFTSLIEIRFKGFPRYWWIGEYFVWNYGSEIHIIASYFTALIKISLRAHLAIIHTVDSSLFLACEESSDLITTNTVKELQNRRNKGRTSPVSFWKSTRSRIWGWTMKWVTT